MASSLVLARKPHYDLYKVTFESLALWLQIAQSRYVLHTLGPTAGMIYILGAIG